ncbi:MAG: hypothetical protein CMJ84_04740 [Planctomycetes bacterium]|nr:hypothetical protein [Planctomycetota bacterium]MDP6407950.1 hypothetical protein [Planctomycetota bacterium]
MNSVRLWVLLLAGTSFLGGLAAGTLMAERARVQQHVTEAFPDYRGLLVRHFDLAPERERELRNILTLYQDSLTEISDRHMAELMSGMEPELSQKGRHFRGLIRNHLLEEEDRPTFDRLCASSATFPTPVD